jgi:hypothetical protein
MADSTVTIAVTTGTQYVTGNTSSIYTFDGSQPASFTFPWVASGTVRLEQSGSTNDGHPLIFSTSNSSVLATMRAGIISSGVTYYLDGSSNESDYTNTTTFNAATTRYIEIAPTSETDFYFACWVHGIGMGGIVDLSLDTWGANAWNYNSWGEQDGVSTALTGLSATVSLGTAIGNTNVGWGSDQWGQGVWGTDTLTVTPTGVEATTLSGPVTWGYPGWSGSSWGGLFVLEVADVMGLTGVSATASVGSPDIKYSSTQIPTGVSSTVSLGSLSINAGADHTQGLSGQVATASLGTPVVTPESIAALTGIAATSATGSVTISSVELIDVTGVSATASVGSISPTEMTMGLTGVSATASVADMTTSSGGGIIAYADIDTGSNITYTDVTAP